MTSLLKELFDSKTEVETEAKLNALKEEWKALGKKLAVKEIKEGVTDLLRRDTGLGQVGGASLEQNLEEIEHRFAAARRGLGLVNKLPNGESKTFHRKRIMGNLNRIRVLLAQVQAAVARQEQERFNSARPVGRTDLMPARAT